MIAERIDPITLEVIRNALASTADEMALIVMRSAYSPVVRDIMDYSTALYDAQGRVIAQGLTLPIQLCSKCNARPLVKSNLRMLSAATLNWLVEDGDPNE